MNMPKFNTWNDYFNWLEEQATPTRRVSRRTTAKIHNRCVRNRTRRYASASTFVQWMTQRGLAPDQLSKSERKEAARHGMTFRLPMLRGTL